MGRYEFAFSVVPVRDLDRATDFYRDAFGLAFDETATTDTAVKVRELPLWLEKQPSAGTDDSKAGRLAFRVEDLETEYARLSGLNIKFRGSPVEHEDRWDVTALDPDGNEIELIEYKAAGGPPVTSETTVNDIIFPHPETMEVFEEHGIRICGGCLVLLNAPVRITAEYSGLNRSESAQLVVELNEKLEEIESQYFASA